MIQAVGRIERKLLAQVENEFKGWYFDESLWPRQLHAWFKLEWLVLTQSRRAHWKRRSCEVSTGYEKTLTFFEFVLVMISVIYALSVAPLLSGVVRIAQSSASVRHYFPQAIWVANTFLLILISWWALWGFRSVEWTFSDFVLISIEPVLLYFVCSLLYPQRIDEAQVDLEFHFKKVCGVLYVATFVFILLASFDGVVLGIEPAWNINRYFQAAVLVIIAWAFLDRRPVPQLSASILYLMTALVFTGLRWFSPPA